MSMTLQQTLETYRPSFEYDVWKAYVEQHSAMQRTDLKTGLEAVLLLRDKYGDYADSIVNAAWLGFCFGLQHEWRNGQREWHNTRRIRSIEAMLKKPAKFTGETLNFHITHRPNAQTKNYTVHTDDDSAGYVEATGEILADTLDALIQRRNVRL